MKKIYLLFLLATFFSFNQINAQEPCPDSAVINGGGSKMTVTYTAPINCGTMPDPITTAGPDPATWSLSNCVAGNNTAFYTLVSGTPPPIGGTFTIDTGFDAVCDYNDSVLPISDFDFLNSTLKIYPNPLTKNNELNLKFAINTTAKIYMYDVTGKLAVMDEVNNVSIKQINTSVLTNGVYFLRLVTDNTTITRKVIIMK